MQLLNDESKYIVDAIDKNPDQDDLTKTLIQVQYFHGKKTKTL